MYGEIPNARIEKLLNPPPEKAFNTVRKSLPDTTYLTLSVSINGMGIYVPALKTNSKAKVINIFRTISRLLKINFTLFNKIKSPQLFHQELQ